MGNETNYKPLFIDKVEEFIKECPKYSIGEIIYSMLTQMKAKGIEVNRKEDFLKLTDDKVYSGIDSAIKKEKEDERN